jgi:c(7)-type cytochrome triheme protein
VAYHRWLRGLVLAGLAGLALMACRSALNTVFDVPPPRPATPPGPPARGGLAALPGTDTVRPAAERTLHADSVRGMLPKDAAGNVDWAEALRLGVIRPRSVLPGRPAPAEPGFQFKFDFTYQGPDTTFDARFPHSTHTEWLDCQQCHPRIFPYRNTPVTMGDIFQGKYCAECHGKVSFPVMTGCERCHTRLVMPPGRATPDFLGTVQLRRVGDKGGNAAMVQTDSLPASIFPHWVHRIRYRCKACHMQLFEPRAGTNAVTMAEIKDGQACGQCHNGRDAFAASIGTCQRCHVAPTAPVGTD